MKNYRRIARFASVPALFAAGAASAADYSSLTVDTTGADTQILAVGAIVLGLLGLLLVIRLVKRAVSG